MALHTISLTDAQEEALAYFAAQPTPPTQPPDPPLTPDEYLQQLVSHWFKGRVADLRARKAADRDIAYGRLSAQDRAIVDAILAPNLPG